MGNEARFEQEVAKLYEHLKMLTEVPQSLPWVSISDSTGSSTDQSARLTREVAALRDCLSSLLEGLSICAMCGKHSTEAERVVVFCSTCREVMQHVREKAFGGMGKELIKMLSQDDA